MKSPESRGRNSDGGCADREPNCYSSGRFCQKGSFSFVLLLILIKHCTFYSVTENRTVSFASPLCSLLNTLLCVSYVWRTQNIFFSAKLWCLPWDGENAKCTGDP